MFCPYNHDNHILENRRKSKTFDTISYHSFIFQLNFLGYNINVGGTKLDYYNGNHNLQRSNINSCYYNFQDQKKQLPFHDDDKR